jgi:RimJ/RimL family protein N-acetyltransferase
MISLLPFQALEDRHQRMQRWASEPRNKEFFRALPPLFTWNSPAQMDAVFATNYFVREGGKVVGMVCISQADQQNRQAHVGVLFEPGTYNKLICKIMRSRIDLPKVLGLTGFKHEGTLRQSFWNGKGFEDECLFGLLKQDYEVAYGR